MANIVKNNSYMEFPLQIKRQYAAPIDFNEVWYDLEQLKAYAKSGATSYAGQTVKFINEAESNKITIYTIGSDGSLITSGVNDTEIEKWNDTYRKSETDERIKAAKDEVTNKINEIENGRVWKPSVENFEAIATTYPEPQDTWCVITKDTNIIWMYEASKQEWIDLGHSVIHENATQSKDGLMSKEDKKKLDDLQTTLTTLEDKITKAYQAADKTIDDKVNAMDVAYKAADTEINKKISDMDTAYKAADTALTEKITKLTETHNTDKTALEKQIQAVDAKFVAASTEQIEALFQ